MDERMARAGLADAKAKMTRVEEESKAILDRLEKERSVNASLVSALEGWLDFYGEKTEAPAKVSPPTPRAKRAPSASTGPSARASMLQVIREANGEELHTREIVKRIGDMGVQVNGKNPEGMADLSLYESRKSGQPIERTATKTWRWASPPSDKG